MPFEREIKEAKKIGDGWIAKGESYKNSFALIKKEHLALEKGGLKDIQRDVADGAADVKKHLEQLETVKERFQMFIDEGQRLYKEFDAWALGEPRSSMTAINKKLQLGDEKDEKYKAVAAGIKTQLTDVATVIAEVQRAWRSDLEVALKNNMDKLTTLEQIINKETGKNKGFLDQLEKAIDRYAAECKTAYVALKMDVIERDLEDLKAGKMAQKDPTIIVQKQHVVEQRIAIIPKIVAQIEKNYRRVGKTVPDDFLDSFVAKGAKAHLAKVKAEIDKQMADAADLCARTVEAFKKLPREK